MFRESVSIHFYTKEENHQPKTDDNKTQIELFISVIVEVVHESRRTSQLIQLNGEYKKRTDKKTCPFSGFIRLHAFAAMYF